jgi:hypothetical protein
MTEPKERPIIFSSPMVRAILQGRKTQTRRVAKLNLSGRVALGGKNWHCDDPEARLASPYGQPGDRLYVKEQCWIWGRWTRNGLTKTGRQKWRFIVAGDRRVIFEKPDATAKRSAPEGLHGKSGWVYRNARFMPRWASRITLEIVAVRIERLQDISQPDAKAEGVDGYLYARPGVPGERLLYRKAFMELWGSINGSKQGCSWSSNPWVWVVEFKRVTK